MGERKGRREGGRVGGREEGWEEGRKERREGGKLSYLSFSLWHTQQVPNKPTESMGPGPARAWSRHSVLITLTFPTSFKAATEHAEAVLPPFNH